MLIMAYMACSLVLLPMDCLLWVLRSEACFSHTFYWLEMCMHHIIWCLHQWEGLLLVPNPGCYFFVKFLVEVPPGVVGTFFCTMHSLWHSARRDAFFLLDLRLSPVPAFGTEMPLPLLGFCFLAIFSVSLILPLSIVTSAVRAKFRLPFGRQPPDVVVDWGLVCLLFQFKIQELVNCEWSRWDLVLLVVLLLASHVIDNVFILAEFEGAPQNFELVCEYYAAGF